MTASASLVVGVLVALALGSSPARARAQSTATEVRVAVPFDPRGLVPALRVSARAAGSCWTASLASAGRPDAWRCRTGNQIHDPCFAGFVEGGQVAACLASPWSSEVTLLALSGTLPRGAKRPATLAETPPWALELASGERCTMLTGATWGVAGMRVNYGCPGDVSVVGDIDRGGPAWKAFVLRAGEAAMSQVEIRVAYY
jgi:hypothetical protein